MYYLLIPSAVVIFVGADQAKTSKSDHSGSEHSVYPTEGSYRLGLRVHNVKYGILTQYEIAVRYSPTLYILEEAVKPKDGDFTAPDLSKENLAARLAGWFCLICSIESYILYSYYDRAQDLDIA